MFAFFSWTALKLPPGRTTVMHLVARETLPEPNSHGKLPDSRLGNRHLLSSPSPSPSPLPSSRRVQIHPSSSDCTFCSSGAWLCPLAARHWLVPTSPVQRTASSLNPPLCSPFHRVLWILGALWLNLMDTRSCFFFFHWDIPRPCLRGDASSNVKMC